MTSSNNCYHCGLPVLDEECVKLTGPVYLHWDCFYQYGQSLEGPEQLVSFRAGDISEAVNALADFYNVVSMDLGHYGEKEEEVGERLKELGKLIESISQNLARQVNKEGTQLEE